MSNSTNAQVVSLGGYCQLAAQLERRVGDRRFAGPFDWLVSPLRAVAAALSDPSTVCASLRPICGGHTMQCVATRLVPHHEFERDDTGTVQLTSDALVAARSKFLHKFASARSRMEGQRGLFIRYSGLNEADPQAHPHLDDRAAPVGADDICRLHDAAREAFGVSDSRLVFVYHGTLTHFTGPATGDGFDAIDLGPVEINHLPEPDRWKGDPRVWDRVFEQVGL